jgi:hypothetical protein
MNFKMIANIVHAIIRCKIKTFHNAFEHYQCANSLQFALKIHFRMILNII